MKTKTQTQIQRKLRAYSKPTCFMIKMEGMDMIAASPNPPVPPDSFAPPTSEGGKVNNPNPAKEYTGFDAWSTWE
nr:hypothetical protein [Prevotella sp.]